MKSRKSKRSARRSRRSRKSKVRISIDKDTAIVGYKFNEALSTRRAALRRAVGKLGRNTLIRRLNALSIVHKNTNPAYSAKAKADMHYVQSL